MSNPAAASNPTELSPDAYRAHIAADIARVAEILPAHHAPEWSAPVPTCGEWTLRDLVVHLGIVHRMVVRAIAERVSPRGFDDSPAEGTDLSEWFREGAAAALEALDAPPETPAWTFYRDRDTVGFWLRRQAMENLIHRIDAELALGAETGIDVELARDGIAEVIDDIAHRMVAVGRFELPDRGIVVEASDGPRDDQAAGEAARFEIGTPEPRRAPDATGPAAELLLALWKRRTVSGTGGGGVSAADIELLDEEAAEALALPLTP
ncbi:maleylpyruvate isomerase family mycothiol-dependent enzyme [Dietzia sp.]|uniref:maleylpyruvate isomerase family mycothiol-dependent enzyme n=1 Tax=Dietzia sp. TaxID=1871616 RepID=UPI002FDA7569